MMTDQLKSSEGLNVPGPHLSNAEVRFCKQSWTSEKLAAFAMHVTSSAILREILSAQVVPSHDRARGRSADFEPNQDAETRQVLSVQVDVSEVRSLDLHTSCSQ